MTNYNQLSSDGKEISWIDNTPTRFQMYSTLTDDDYAIIRGSGDQKSVYIGKIKNKTITSNEVNLVINIKEEFSINGDKLLCVNEISPEFQSQMKAHFKPFISERPIDIDKVINELKNENYIDFYIINTNHSNFQGLLKQIKQNDRVVFYGEEFKNFYIAKNFNQEGDYPSDAFSSKGKTLDDLIQIFNQMSKADKQKSKNVAVLEKIKDSIVKDGIYKFNSFAYYWNIIHNKSAGNKLLTDDEEDKMNNFIIDDIPLNTILYGPPGTGKTFSVVNHALSIIESKSLEELENEERQDNGRIQLRKRFNNLLISNWENPEGQIGFITFHQSMSYEDFIEGIKPLKPGEEDKTVFYDIKDGIFKLISNLAKKDKSNFNTMIDNLKMECSEFENKKPIKIKSEYSTFTITYRDGRTFRVKPEQSAYPDRDYPASIENIRKVYENPENTNVYNLTYVRGILNYLYTKGLVPYEKADTDTKKTYVLIIDEINRGNVSQIFGELITLIEDDKRSGKPEAIELSLPYSNEKFTVPPNLYIIGTMNTADRSVEALDAALRRRFSFEFMPPRYDLPELNREIGGIKLSLLLKTINERITYLLDEDHQIGHAYFMNINKDDSEVECINKLKLIFGNKIIPLLKEYFYNDYQKIGLVLGEDFITKISNPFKSGSSELFNDDREVYRLVNIDSDWLDDKKVEFNIIESLKKIVS